MKLNELIDILVDFKNTNGGDKQVFVSNYQQKNNNYALSSNSMVVEVEEDRFGCPNILLKCAC